jgi:SET domain
MIIGTLTAVLLAALPFDAHRHRNDATFHSWCQSVGIETPMAQVRTTEESVAGRGVFATRDVEEGSVVMRIPERIVLHNGNAALYFPETADLLARRRAKLLKQYRRRHSWWNRIFNRSKAHEFEFADPSDWWQAELSLYCMECIKTNHHPWNFWISQWSRNDPVQRLLEKGATLDDCDEVDECVAELAALLPEASRVKLFAAVDIRLRRMDSLKQLFRINDDEGHFHPLYGRLLSRAIELGEQSSGVIPGFDMINHSPTPNLALAFDGRHFEMIALRNIAEDEEV